MSPAPIRVLILGTGMMGGKHAEMFAAIDDAEVVAAVDTDADRLRDFCHRHGIPRRFETLEQAIAWGGFDAAANVTPDAVHHATTLKLAAAGKHVLCEKPLAPNFAQALEMTEAMETRGLVNLVNLRYRTIPAFAEAARLVAGGAIGAVRHIEASYLQSWLVGNHWGDWRTDPRWLWRLSSAHGSAGTLGDIGIHVLDAVCFVAGLEPTSVHCRLATFDKAPGGRIGDYRLDANDSFAMSVAFTGGALGLVHGTRTAPGRANALKISIFGTAGGLEASFEKEAWSARICNGEDVHSQTWRQVPCPPGAEVYDRFIEAIRTGAPAQPDFRTAARRQQVLDACFESHETAAAVDVSAGDVPAG